MLLVETMSGLLAGALAYRMRGEGLILALYGSQQPHLEMVNYYNLDPAETAIIQVIEKLHATATLICSLELAMTTSMN